MRDRRRNYDKSCAGLPSRDPLCCPYRFVGAPRQSPGGDRPRLYSVVRSTVFRREFVQKRETCLCWAEHHVER